MKKILLFTIIVGMSLTNVNAQDTTFGLSAGYNSLIAVAKVNDISSSDSAPGFYIGAFADFKISERIYIHPELQFVSTRQDGESGNMLAIPIMGKFYIANKFNIQFGPQLDIIIDDSEGVKKFGVALSVGTSYDISEDVFISARYAFALSNRLDSNSFIIDEIDPIIQGLDIKAKFNFFQIGLGYKL